MKEFILFLLLASPASAQFQGGSLINHGHTSTNDGGQLGSLNISGTFSSPSTATIGGITIGSDTIAGVTAFTGLNALTLSTLTINNSITSPSTFNILGAVNFSGNVGIGSSSPAAALDVNGTARASGVSMTSSALIVNDTNSNNARIGVGTNGAVIDRNQSGDTSAKSVLAINNRTTGSPNLITFINNSSSVAYMSSSGALTLSSSVTVGGVVITSVSIIWPDGTIQISSSAPAAVFSYNIVQSSGQAASTPNFGLGGSTWNAVNGKVTGLWISSAIITTGANRVHVNAEVAVGAKTAISQLCCTVFVDGANIGANSPGAFGADIFTSINDEHTCVVNYLVPALSAGQHIFDIRLKECNGVSTNWYIAGSAAQVIIVEEIK